MLARCTFPLEGFAPSWVRLSKAETRTTKSMSPRATAKLAVIGMAFRLAAIAISFDIGHLAFFFGPCRNSERPLDSLHRRSPVVLT